tara:strand:+ start:283 stop:612 length:330 start_codon:yes stop_codon:yes gene_type:complete
MEPGVSRTPSVEISNAEVPKRSGRIAVLKVLVAEDERFQREAFAALFDAANGRLVSQRIKFELTQVASANAVLDMLAETTDWQLVLLDVFMPDLCGTEIIQAQLGREHG